MYMVYTTAAAVACGNAGANMVGTLPPIYESLPDLTLFFAANNPGTAMSVHRSSHWFLVHTHSFPVSLFGRHLCTVTCQLERSLSAVHCIALCTLAAHCSVHCSLAYRGI